MILSPGSTLLLGELGNTREPAVAETGGVAARTLEDVEREHILRVLDACEGRVRGHGNAASQLGLNARTLYSRMKKPGIRQPAPARQHKGH